MKIVEVIAKDLEASYGHTMGCPEDCCLCQGASVLYKVAAMPRRDAYCSEREFFYNLGRWADKIRLEGMLDEES